MVKRKSLMVCAIGGAAFGVLFLACSNSNSGGGSPRSGGDDPTPSGTTPVTAAPYAVCAALEQGSFTTTSGGAFPAPATKSCSPAGEPTPGPADTHCAGQPYQTVSGGSCSIDDAGPAPSDDAGPASGDGGGGASEDAGVPAPGPCDENGIDGEYGSTHYNTTANDDDCKYQVSYSASPICENDGTYFVVTANYLTRTLADGGLAPLTEASTFAEVCLSDTHPGPSIDARPPAGSQQVVEGPPGTYTIGPVQFDAPGNWTVRFHFNEFCCDVADDSPHGHAAFFVTVP
jgi:hypothetical protein